MAWMYAHINGKSIHNRIEDPCPVAGVTRWLGSTWVRARQKNNLAFLHPYFTITLTGLHSQKSSKQLAIPAVLLNQIDSTKVPKV